MTRVGQSAKNMPQRQTEVSDSLADVAVLSLQGANSLDFLEVVFDCYQNGQVFAIGRADTNLANLVGRIETKSMPETPRLGWGKLDYHPNPSDTAAQIVFTSGTEGEPKPIVLSHGNLADAVSRLNSIMGITSDIREYIGVPVTYSFGLGRVRAISAVGGQFFLPERFDPVEIRKMLDAGDINAISAVPSLWQVVLANPEVIGAAGETVRWIEIGSQNMSGTDKAAMKSLFPNAKIVQHYGLSEASRATFLDLSSAVGAELDSVGSAIGDGQVRISFDDAIELRGSHVAIGLLTVGGVIEPMTDEDGWLTTKDRGELRDGQLYYLGRLDNQINISGIKIAAEALEQDVAEIVTDSVGQFAITSVPDALRGQLAMLVTEDSAGDRVELIETAAKLALERRGIAASGALRTHHVATLPRTGTDKIQRGKLRKIRETIDRTEPKSFMGHLEDSTPVEQGIVDTWRKVVGAIEIGPNQTFYDAGGDSLSSVQIGIVMEAARYNRAAVRATLEGRTVHEVALLAERDPTNVRLDAQSLPDQTAKSWAISLTRGVMVLSVLLSHWGPGLFGKLGIADQAERYISIFYRMGTPGFATIFGIGIGYFMVPGFFQKRASVMARLRSSLVLVLIGIALGAALDLLLVRMQGLTITGQNLAHATYGVLVYYAMMLASAGLWLPTVARLKRPVLPLLFAMPIFWFGWQISLAIVPVPQLDSILELPRLMLIAGYNVFKLTGLAVVGMAVGVWFAGQKNVRQTGQTLFAVGALGVIICVLTILQNHGIDAFAKRSNAVFISLPGLLLYSFLGTMMLGGFLSMVLVWNRLPGLLRIPLQVLIVVGGLALPIYVFHELVIPARNVLLLSGLSDGMALTVPLALFVTMATYGGWRLYRMYFK